MSVFASCNDLEMDATVPGGVYLCQVSETVSCGACCGLYNVSDISRANLTNLLRHRSRLFQKTERTIAAIDTFAHQVNAVECSQRPYEKFHHCHFIGLIGEPYSRVGCLLHPLADGNAGVDLRGLSYYGGLACQSYFCATTRELLPRFKKILRAVIDDWFFYGLIITENKLLAALFERIESGLGEPLDHGWFHSPRAVDLLKEMLYIKYQWPFRPEDQNTACHYLFKDHVYDRPAIDYGKLQTNPSSLDTILQALGSSFETVEQLLRAGCMVNEKIDALVDCLRSTRQDQVSHEK